MERLIRYTRAADGVRIAYWTLGAGEPLVYLAGGPWNHIEHWEVPQCRAWYERLAQNRMLVRYDARGTGLSERAVSELSLEAYLGDLEAVVSELGLTRFDVFAAGDAGPVAVSYAVRHPGRVSRIIMWCAWAKGSDFETSPRIQAWRGLIDQDWELMSETCAHLAFGWDAGGIGRKAAEAFRASITRETAQAALEATVSSDVTGSLPQLDAPTLVIHRSGVSWLPVEIALKLASSIPDSRLAIMEGESTAPYLGDTEALATAIDEFLSGTSLHLAEAGAADAQAGETSGSGGTSRQTSAMLSPGQRNTGVVEILPLYLRGGRIFRHHPDDAGSWQVGFEPARHPGDIARSELGRVECSPIVVHSTSWRIEEERLVLTYAAVIPEPISPKQRFESAPVHPRELARGTARGAPEEINVEEVVEHAVRHLAWLVREDEPIREALGGDWREALARYKPEPFSAFDLSGALSEEDGCLLCTRFARPLSQFVSGEPAVSLER